MKVEVEFTKDFATKQKGDREFYDSQVASSLIHECKVAKLYVKEIVKKEPKNK